MDFSFALLAAKQGIKVKRASWAGYIAIQQPDAHSVMNRPYFYAVCLGGEVVPAVINNLDMLAEDWDAVKDAPIATEGM